MPDAARRQSPVFLVSAPQSGAEALRQMLTRHPAIAIAPEFDFLVDAIKPDGRFMKREAFLRSIELDDGFKRLGLTPPVESSLSGIAHGLLDQVASAKSGATVVGFTLGRHFDRILWLWPDARFIHLVRDGRDGAHAMITAGRAGTLWHGIADWVEAETVWDRMAHKLAAERRISVRHEALTSQPEAELRRLTDYLGLPFEPAMLEQRGLPIHADAGLWRKTNPAERAAAEHRAARWLLHNGYFLSGTVRPPSALRRVALGARNRMVIASRRRALLGTKAWLKSCLPPILRGGSD